MVLTDRFEPAATARVIVEHRVSGVAGVPSMYRALLDLPPAELRAAFAGVRLCTSGGAPLPPAWLADFRAVTGLSIVEGYGLSEAGPVVTTNVLGGAPKPGSVGRPLPGIELRLVDRGRPPAGRGGRTRPRRRGRRRRRPVRPGDDTGLVAVRGPNLFSGYWPDGAGGPDAEGWFRTADVGFIDADGDLHLVDRSSDLVIVNGFNVYPREVEQVLGELAGVAEAAVVGVPDDRTGEARQGRAGARGGRRDHRGRGARALRRAPGPVQGARRHHVRRRAAAHADGQGRAPPARGAGRMSPARVVGLHPRRLPGVCDGRGRGGADLRRARRELDRGRRRRDAELRAEYGDRVPVIMVDGREHGFWRVEEARFRAALAG